MTTPEITFRHGTIDDARACWDLSMAAMGDYFVRQGLPWDIDPDAFWGGMESFLGHLAEHAAEWWIAEDATDGSIVGYARSVERGKLIELSDSSSVRTTSPPGWAVS